MAGKYQDPKGGLNDAGRKHFGVKAGVKNYSSASEGDKKRWVRWALRFTKTPRPLKDDKGRPTRYASMFAAWGEPIPSSAGAVSAVHSKALTRRGQLKMGQDSEKAALDTEFADWDEEIALTLRERLQAAYGSMDGATRHTFIAGGTGDCMSCGRPQVSPAHDVADAYLAESEDCAGAPDAGVLQTSEYTGSGCMVALYPSEAALAGLKISGDLPLEDRKDMHVTLAYMATTPEGDELDRLKAVVAGVAHTEGPMEGVWGGTARFNPSEGSEGKPVLVALPDIPNLPDFRQDLVEALDAAGFEVSKAHGYTPHLTVAYDDNGQVRAQGDLRFDEVTLAAAGERYSYPLSADDVEQADAKRKTHRFVGAHHLRDHVVSHAGYFGGCYACGQPKDVDDHDGDVGDTPAAGAASSAGSAGAQTALAMGPEDDSYLKGLQDQLVTGIDAAVDQAMTLLRSTPDLPPYAAQAQALLSLVDDAIDFMLLIRGLPDADDADADKQDQATQDRLSKEAAALTTGAKAVAALSDTEKREMKIESVHIQGRKDTPEAKVPHEFAPAKYPSGAGHPRCVVCGREPTPSNICNDPLHVADSGKPLVGGDKLDTMVGPKDIKQLAYAVDRVKADDLPPVTLPAVRAFLTEAHGRSILTAPASLVVPVWEKALTPNEHMLWMQGKFVGAEKANRNGAFWNTADLQMGEPTVKHGPLNWLHEAKHVIGTIADAKLIQPDREAAGESEPAHISAVAAIWRWVYPDEAYVIEQASDQQKLYYSMECVSREVACIGDGGCGQTFPYMTMIKTPYDVCKHIREKSATRQFVDPTFLGGAAIVPPVRPGWGEANASVMREAAALSEKAYEDAGSPTEMSATEWERLMAGVLAYANR